ncbi:carboxymethylenebutenolidase [Nocardia transvalensis]|uniref:Carboxymethylenebutenolidase n=1 Tax=Nocardia transvalensis TaxID=37333 RepID=A0A7W9UM55_9NOCA|nr:dienelactone hydrolase family protein [Nocardia transvalensis]MBB5918286.1 carboxymethylenebutenolidase [Nocardia transvalensis]
MISETVRISTADGVADAFVAFPDEGERHPGVLLYMDIFGVRRVLEERARELAGHGYYVLVPNVFYRHGNSPVVDIPEFIGADNRQEVAGRVMPLYQAHTEERARRDADAYLEFLAGRPEVSDGPVAAIGYCMGAVLALRTAAAHPDKVGAVAGFHPGALVTDAPDSPHRLASGLAARVHLGIAENDMTPEAVGELERALDAAGVEHTCEIYPGTVHGFTMSDTAAFSPEGLQRHWDRLLPLLSRALTAG